MKKIVSVLMVSITTTATLLAKENSANLRALGELNRQFSGSRLNRSGHTPAVTAKRNCPFPWWQDFSNVPWAGAVLASHNPGHGASEDSLPVSKYKAAESKGRLWGIPAAVVTGIASFYGIFYLIDRAQGSSGSIVDFGVLTSGAGGLIGGMALAVAAYAVVKNVVKNREIKKYLNEGQKVSLIM